MARSLITINGEVKGLAAAVEALAGIIDDARFAQKTAMRKVARAARKEVAKTFAAQLGVPQKVFSKRVQAIAQKAESNLSVWKLWSGFKFNVRWATHKAAAKQIENRNPKGFHAKMSSGHEGWFVRRKPTRPGPRGIPEFNRQAQNERAALPIDEIELDVPNPSGTMLSKAEYAMRVEYQREVEQEFIRRRIASRKRKA